MDRVELGRQDAAARHDATVALGGDPWQPLDFAKVAAEQEGLAADAVALGAISLQGARAVLIQQTGLILYANEGSPFEQAFLIAHELGHHCLGDAEGDHAGAVTVDPARSAEDAPVGMERVVDYSRRQRREVQMDLFARELLLPRHWVRRLHLEQGMSASSIAQRIGAPFEVVAQQLLDALLLPKVDLATEEGSERPLNAQQAVAAQHAGAPYLLVAGPGTGKTRTLVGRVEHLLEQGAEARKILALTFSNKAAGEIAERIARSRPQAAAAIWAGTFHAFGLDILRRFHEQLGLPADPKLLDRSEAVELLENEFPRLDLRRYRNIHDPTDLIADMLTAISRAKDEVVDAQAYEALAQRMAEASVDEAGQMVAEKAMEVAKVYHAYERLKREAGAVDFGDLICLPVSLLEGNATARDMLQGSYEHVLVDEYQDVNRSSVRLLKALCGNASNLWVVGDAKQSIYRFRGASSINVERFEQDFPGGQRFSLRKNYRSVPEVLNACTSFAETMAVASGDETLEPDRKSDGHRPQLDRVQTGSEEPPAIADNIRRMQQAGHRFGDQAVLCSGNERLSRLGHELEALGVPVLFLGNLFERPEIKDLLAVLSLLVDRRATGLLRTSCLPDFSMSLEDVKRVIGHLRNTGAGPEAWRKLGGTVEGLTEEGGTALARLDQALAGAAEASSPWGVLASFMLDHTRFAAGLASSQAAAEQSKGISIWQLMNFLRVQPVGKGLPIKRLLDRVRRLIRLRDDRDLRQLPAAAQRLDAVRLMTIHGAKGLEFPVIHLAGMNAGTLPRSLMPLACPPPVGMIAGASNDVSGDLRQEHDKEQECLFYVALSRARDRLFLYAATVNAINANRPLSPFVARLGDTLQTRAITPSQAPTEDPTDSALEVIVSGELRVKGHEMGLYQKCPRRFLYTCLLQIGGKRTQTPFMLMHEAVRATFQEVARTGASDPNQVGAMLGQVFDASELAEHGYASDYRALATKMLAFFIRIRMGQPPQEPVTLTMEVDGAQVAVTADDVFVSGQGAPTYRRVHTGHKPRDDTPDVGAIAFLAAARKASPQASVEFVYLSDEKHVRVVVTQKQFSNGQAKVRDTIGWVRAGKFPVKPSDRMCSGCPAFFVCGPLPPGRLQLDE